MLNDYRIIDIEEIDKYYYHSTIDGKIDPRDTLVYIHMCRHYSVSNFHFPLLHHYVLPIYAYLSKLGYFYHGFVVPATGLRYLAVPRYIEGKAIIEIFDIDEISNKLNIPGIVSKALANKSTKELTVDDFYVVEKLFDSQKIFDGHNAYIASKILDDYFTYYLDLIDVNQIISDYNKIFTPLYKACYETETWNRIPHI